MKSKKDYSDVPTQLFGVVDFKETNVFEVNDE